MEAGREAENGEHDCGPNSRTLSFSQNLTYGTGFSKTLLRRKNIVNRGQHASRWSATRMAKKLSKNLSSPLTEAGLLMEDAEAQRNQFASAPGGVGTLQEVAQKGDLAADEHG
jgi:hypothetical protein